MVANTICILSPSEGVCVLKRVAVERFMYLQACEAVE